MINWTAIKSNRYWLALKRHYSAPLFEVFKQFRLGLSIFFVGMVGVYTGYNLASSLTQEIILAASLILVAVGFFTAMLAQIRMLIIRIVQFINDK